MKLEKRALVVIGERLRESRAILERTHQRISQSLESLENLRGTVASARRILDHRPPQTTSVFQVTEVRE